MAWIKFEKDLLTDPRLLRIARTLENQWILDTNSKPINGVEFGNGIALPAVTLVCGALIRLWSLADTHLSNDDILPLGIDELDDMIGLPGLCALMPTDWLLPIDGNAVKLPGFHEHNGTEAKKKAVTRKRVARFRARNAPALPAVTLDPILPDQTRPDKTSTSTPPKKASKKNAPPLGVHDLVALGVEEQIARDWMAVRKAKHAPLTGTALKELEREAGKAGITAAQAIGICAKRSWQGFNAAWNWRDESPGPRLTSSEFGG